MAAALDSGKITGNEYFNCNGYRDIGGFEISCHNEWGDGEVSVQKAVEISCNVALMDIAAMMGKDTFVDYQHIFNFGLKTNIDLWGESRTANVVYNKDNIGSTYSLFFLGSVSAVPVFPPIIYPAGRAVFPVPFSLTDNLSLWC